MLSCHSSGPIITPLWPSSYVGATLPPDTTLKTQRCLHVFWQIQLLHASIVGDQLCPKLLGDPWDPWDGELQIHGKWRKIHGKIGKSPMVPKKNLLVLHFPLRFRAGEASKKKTLQFPRCFWQAQRFSVAADRGNGTFDNNTRGWLSQNLVFSNDHPRENA